MIYHIRRRLKKQRGNQWYKDRSNRSNGTYCGAGYTDHDIVWNDKAEEFNGWEPCKECVKLRENGR